jgi:N-acetylglutamate synthase-like GNAT family acetyltransferase
VDKRARPGQFSASARDIFLGRNCRTDSVRPKLPVCLRENEYDNHCRFVEENCSDELLMIEVRKLEALEYRDLAAIEEGFCPNPEKSIVIVAKHEQRIIGRLMLVAPTHIEGAWVHEDFRGETVLKRMVECLEREAKKAGIGKLFAYGTEETNDYLRRLGFAPVPWTVWEKTLAHS